MQSDKVLVTGAGGLIGSAICADLSRAGFEIKSLLQRDESDENLLGLANLEIIRGDVRDENSVSRAMSGCNLCIHCAALNELWHRPSKDYYEINVTGTQNVCKAAMSAGVIKFIYTSSCEVMGPSKNDRPRNEKIELMRARVKGHYEKSKFMAEEIVKSFIKAGLPGVVIRPTAVFGPRDIHLSPPGRLIKNFLAGNVGVYYDTGINVVDSRDVAAAHVAALKSDRIGDIYIAGGHNIMLKDLFRKISRITRMDEPSTEIKYSTAYITVLALSIKSLITGRDPGITLSGISTIRHPWFFDSSKAAAELRFKARPIDETLADAIAWHRSRRS